MPDPTPKKKALGKLGTKRVGTTAEGRPIIENPDGSRSTERSITGQWGPKGEWVNIPSMYGGKQVSEKEAVNIIRSHGYKDPETGRSIKMYKSLSEAESAARSRSEVDLGKYGGRKKVGYSKGILRRRVGQKPTGRLKQKAMK